MMIGGMGRMVLVMMVVVVVVVTGVRGAYDEADWGFQSYLDEDFFLLCDHPDLDVEPHNHVEWKLPNGQMVTMSTDKYVLSHGLRDTVTNMNLTIMNVQDSDAGVYVCHVYNNIRKEVWRGQLLRGLNMGGPKYREPFDEYRTNLMVGGLAAVVLFVPLVTACFVYKFRFQTKEQKAAKHAARLEATKHQRYLADVGNGSSGAELSEVAVTVDKGKSNAAYDNSEYRPSTRL